MARDAGVSLAGIGEEEEEEMVVEFVKTGVPLVVRLQLQLGGSGIAAPAAS